MNLVKKFLAAIFDVKRLLSGNESYVKAGAPQNDAKEKRTIFRSNADYIPGESEKTWGI